MNTNFENMDIKAEKLDLIQWLVNVSDSRLISELLEWRKSHERATIDEYNKDLNLADAEVENGDFVDHKTAEQEIGSWREK